MTDLDLTALEAWLTDRWPDGQDLQTQRISGGPWHIKRCDGSGVGTCREDFVELGVGASSADGRCGGITGEIRLLTWVCPEA